MDVVIKSSCSPSIHYLSPTANLDLPAQPHPARCSGAVACLDMSAIWYGADTI